MFGALLNLARENSKSFKEVEELLDLHRVDLPPFSLNYLRDFLISKGIQSSRALYMNQNFTLNSKLNQVLIESETSTVTDKMGFDAFLIKSSPSFVLNYPSSILRSDAILLNAVSLKWGWFDYVQRQNDLKPFYSNQGQVLTQTNYLHINANAKHFSGRFLSVISLPLIGQNGKKIDGISAYLISEVKKLERRNFNVAMLQSIHTQLSAVKEQNIDLLIPVFILQNILKLNSSHFESLLNISNSDLEVLSKEPLKIVNIMQAVNLCVTEINVNKRSPESGDKGIPNMSQNPSSNSFIFDWPFHFVVIEQKTGSPILISNVNSVMSGKGTC
ncbi:hypothetical protein HMI55_000362 [Coelomomyces lativittatus]|nr:hypothetical protein HMI55_000362 [Coelomomyces lativittatus]